MARRQSRVLQDDEDVELNMTPMLDVVFILLIFFIVTSVFVKEPGVEVERPAAVTQERERPTILVAVTGADEIWINRDVYEMNQIRTVLEQLLSENPRAEAMIQGDQEAPVGTVLDVQEMLLEMEVPVTISTQEP
ncbi:biopolymer transporter ExbD [Marinicauda salina]|jgi:biopolymer transport protein ExbD|uniref:Biopolymer transporter ExbD n=1 Tax=Marinicauda salina TaxID=2135793 RepID=A0A2U2BSL3_9PROT|nr:biopolymer transporter ExbD [Marinicauda salina]PWE16987.1 biopolymer transporter ExbD [Marinicauda salina]